MLNVDRLAALKMQISIGNKFVRAKIVLSGDMKPKRSMSKGLMATKSARAAIEAAGGKFENKMAKQGALSGIKQGGLTNCWTRPAFLFLAIIVFYRHRGS